jgi:ribonuclease E
VRASAEVETAQEAERAARRRSTVREKVSFLVDAQPEAATPVSRSQPEPAAPAPAESSSAETDDSQPRRAGWWSRRFGNGE